MLSHLFDRWYLQLYTFSLSEKLQSVDEILEKIQAQLDGTHVQMETWKHDIVQSMEKFKSKLEEKIKSMDNKLTGVDGQVDLLFKELSDISTYLSCL